MLTDSALRNLKPKSKIYKVSDRDGMYVTVSTSGTVSFRYDYRLNGRRETLILGRYGPGGISLAMARELLFEVLKSVLAGISPALEKQREKRRVGETQTFGGAMEAWFTNARLADSTRAMRKHIIDRDILLVLQNRLLTEVEPEDLRALCNKVKDRGAPATAVQTDTSSLTLDNLVGPAGYAGLEDDVGWHWDWIFAGVLMITLLGVGAELAAPENCRDGDRVIIAGRDSLQDSVNQVGQEVARRNLNIQPTLTIRPGSLIQKVTMSDVGQACGRLEIDALLRAS